ncbi:MAG: hypothetical protein Udaeo2_33730 [Candidatus Udaeobacter sp.]|nr:MAG: hypothetical protein Udaeo2_33730 [Candidatus Udaeobacter sp.]
MGGCVSAGACAVHHRLPHAAHGDHSVARCGRCLCLSHRRLGRHGSRNDFLCRFADRIRFFYSVFQGYAPDTDLDNVRNRVVGILLASSSQAWSSLTFGLSARSTDSEMRCERRFDNLRSYSKFHALMFPSKSTSGSGCSHSGNLKSFDQARRYAELTAFELKSRERLINCRRLNWKAFSLVRRRSLPQRSRFCRADAQQNQSRTALLSEIGPNFKD